MFAGSMTDFVKQTPLSPQMVATYQEAVVSRLDTVKEHYDGGADREHFKADYAQLKDLQASLASLARQRDARNDENFAALRPYFSLVNCSGQTLYDKSSDTDPRLRPAEVSGKVDWQPESGSLKKNGPYYYSVRPSTAGRGTIKFIQDVQRLAQLTLALSMTPGPVAATVRNSLESELHGTHDSSGSISGPMLFGSMSSHGTVDGQTHSSDVNLAQLYDDLRERASQMRFEPAVEATLEATRTGRHHLVRHKTEVRDLGPVEVKAPLLYIPETATADLKA